MPSISLVLLFSLSSFSIAALLSVLFVHFHRSNSRSRSTAHSRFAPFAHGHLPIVEPTTRVRRSTVRRLLLLGGNSGGGGGGGGSPSGSAAEPQRSYVIVPPTPRRIRCAFDGVSVVRLRVYKCVIDDGTCRRARRSRCSSETRRDF